KNGLQWGCPEENHPGTQALHGEEFALGRRAALRQIKYRPTKEIVTEEFPFILTTGRTLYQFNAGTMTARTPNLELRPSDLLAVNPSDAGLLELNEGETVRLKSRYGEAFIPVQINAAVKKGELFATFHMPQIFLNRITSPYRDRFVQAPEYKVTAVRIEKL
ncbi:MAG TPA: molybdopterin oxidoreductase family protein, partial [Pyrinomonadaceae bacterium]|nr:molybdopterin oxidoreductase family protein [Pyrinomonadaceae bacterium]